MIVRDSHGIIVQHDPNNPAYVDGGDSVNRTAIMALCGSEIDQDLLVMFSKHGFVVRHPYQEPWNYAGNCTRDQIIPFMAACQWGVGFTVYNAIKKRKWRAQNINKDSKESESTLPDLFTLDHIFWMRDVLNVKQSILTATIGRLWFLLSIFWNALLARDKEHNQIICMMLSMKNKIFLNIYCLLFKEYEDNILNYWGNWRDQKEIGTSIIKRIKEDLWLRKK